MTDYLSDKSYKNACDVKRGQNAEAKAEVGHISE